MIDTEKTTPIVQEVRIAAPASRVFAALTEPQQLVQWWGDDATYRCTDMQSDLRVGGAWRTTGRSSDGSEFAVNGVYREIDAPHVLEYTWMYDWDEEPAAETIVRFELREHEGKTDVRVVHSGFTQAAAKADHEQGWVTVLGWLQRFAETLR